MLIMKMTIFSGIPKRGNVPDINLGTFMLASTRVPACVCTSTCAAYKIHYVSMCRCL